MKIKKLSAILISFILMIAMSGNVLAANSKDVSMEIVEDNICRIDLNDTSYFEKKMVSYDLTKHQVTLQLKVCNNAEAIIPSGELMLVIDSSSSMNETVSGTKTRKDLVLESANKLVEDLLNANSSTLKIGVVTFSTGSETDDEGHLIVGTAADAQKVCDFTNDLSTLTTKISAIEGTGPYTNLDSGLQLAKSSFTSEDNNKYMIILSDGLPNLAVGNGDLVTYDGLTDIINKTKATLNSLSGIKVTTMLTGIPNEESTFRTDGTNIYTYGQVTEEVFGTMENPTVGKFYKINDSEIENTITKSIHDDLLPIANSLEDIQVVDYFPQYMVDNFEMTYVEGIDVSNVSSKIDTNTNSITWNIAKLNAGETAIIQYRLTLKDSFDDAIIGEILDTNQKVDISYKDPDGTVKNKTSDVTPKIRLKKIEVPTPTPPADPTVAPTPLPKAGSAIYTIAFISVVGLTVFFGIKARKIK